MRERSVESGLEHNRKTCSTISLVVSVFPAPLSPLTMHTCSFFMRTAALYAASATVNTCGWQAQQS